MERVFSGKKNGYDRIVEVEQNGHVAPAYENGTFGTHIKRVVAITAASTGVC